MEQNTSSKKDNTLENKSTPQSCQGVAILPTEGGSFYEIIQTGYPQLSDSLKFSKKTLISKVLIIL